MTVLRKHFYVYSISVNLRDGIPWELLQEENKISNYFHFAGSKAFLLIATANISFIFVTNVYLTEYMLITK